MGMIPKINHQLIKTVWKSTGEIEKDFTQNKDLQFRVCPFTIILGAINSTETGYKPPTSIPNDYTSFSKIFTGREAILSVWDNSFDLIEPDLKTINSTGKKVLKVGDVFYGNILSDQLGITYSATPANNAFIQEQAIKNVVINIPNEKKNFNFINNIVSNLYKLYMIPEINKVINNDKSIKVDRQWYILEVASKTYNNENKELAYIQCTFSSLNDKLAHSGLAINQYVQLGAVGEPVAIPTLDLNNNIILDQDYLSPRPVTHAQVTFYGTVGTIAIGLWGRNINKTDNKEITMNPTHLIFPLNYQASTYDPVSFSALPETNYVLTVGAKSTVDTYQQWQEVIAPMYDDGAKKTFEGHILTDVEKTTATNIIENNGKYIPYWNNIFLNGVELDNNKFDTLGNPYFIYFNKNKQKLIGQINGYIINNLKFKNLRNINALMYFIYNSMNEIPLSIRETVKIQLNTIPVFGSFFNGFTGGMDVGFKKVSNLEIPKFDVVNFFISAELYKFYTNVIYSSAKQKNIIPYDVFRNGTPDELPAILGTTSHMTSWTFNLTDNILLSTYDVSTNNIVNNEYMNLVNISQINPNNNQQIYLLPPIEEFNLKSPIFNDDNYNGFYIDMIDILVQGKCNFKLTFYSMPNDYEGAVSDDFSIWAGTYQTVGKASGNIRLIKNNFLLANNTYSFKNKYNYPKAVHPPVPSKIKNTIFIELTDQLKYGVNNNINAILATGNTYEMRPTIIENMEKGKFYNNIIIDVNHYGYENIDNFMNDYETMTFNFNLTMQSHYRQGSLGRNYINNKVYYLPIVIKLRELQNSKNIGDTALFEVYQEDTYNNNSGNHNDEYYKWIFNVNNDNESINPSQTAFLIKAEKLNNIYVNDLLWTNDNPSSGHTTPSSVWFKIMAFKYTKNNNETDNLIKIEYQFIATFGYRDTTSINGANWNLQTTSLVINPKSVT